MDHIDYILVIQALKDRLVFTKRERDKYAKAREYNHKSPNGSLERDKQYSKTIANLGICCERLEKLIEKFEEEATGPKTPQGF